MATVRRNIVIRCGAKFEENIQATNPNGSIMDLTGYSAKMQVRPTITSSTVLLEASTANGRITINAPGGVIMISIGADVTALLDWNVAYYDLEIFTDAVNIFRVTEGYASLKKEVTR